jgi:predicted dithiol-disulfide oxidoreductase (DUF899 family)
MTRSPARGGAAVGARREALRFRRPARQGTLADLFDGRSQLLIYHFMFGPDWKEGCPSCTLRLRPSRRRHPPPGARDVTLTMVSRAPLAKIEPFKQRMGWHFPWVSSFGSDFNYDFRVSFTDEQRATGKVDYNYTLQEFPSAEGPGASVFFKDPAPARSSHLFDVRPRARRARRHVHDAGHGAQGPRRGRPAV